jgi:predicted GIY-YIG superfamily endonuclease
LAPKPLPNMRVPQLPNKRLVALKRGLAHIGFSAAAGLALSTLLLLPMLDNYVSQVRAAATEQALKTFETSWKSRLLDNQALLRTACTTWWFGATHKERALK